MEGQMLSTVFAREQQQCTSEARQSRTNVDKLSNMHNAAVRKREISYSGAHQCKDGPNWALLAGGTLATAVTVALGRKRRRDIKVLREENLVEIAEEVSMTRDDLQTLSSSRKKMPQQSSSSKIHKPLGYEKTEMRVRLAEVRSQDNISITPYAAQRSYTSTGLKPSHCAADNSPPESIKKCYRGFETPSLTPMPQEQLISPATLVSRTGISKRPDIIHKLRQQLKNRDEMILEMQAQILEQDRTIHFYQLKTADLEERLRRAKPFHVAEQESQELYQHASESCQCHARVPEASHVVEGSSKFARTNFPPSKIDVKSSEMKDNEFGVQALHRGFEFQKQHQLVHTLVSDAMRIAEQMRIAKDEKSQGEKLLLANFKEHKMTSEKLNRLELELMEVKKIALDKDVLLEAYRKEQVQLNAELRALHVLFQSQAKELEVVRSSKAASFEDTASHNVVPKYSGDAHSSNHIHQDGSFKNICKSSTRRGRNVVCSYTTLFSKSSECSTVASSSSQISTAFQAKESMDGLEGTGLDVMKVAQAVRKVDAELIEKLLLALQQELDKLYRSLVTPSKLDEKKNCCWHNGAENHIETRREVQGELENLVHQLSLSNKVATGQHIEEEMLVLSKHEAAISELKQRIENLINLCKLVTNSKLQKDAKGNTNAEKTQVFPNLAKRFKPEGLADFETVQVDQSCLSSLSERSHSRWTSGEEGSVKDGLVDINCNSLENQSVIPNLRMPSRYQNWKGFELASTAALKGIKKFSYGNDELHLADTNLNGFGISQVSAFEKSNSVLKTGPMSEFSKSKSGKVIMDTSRTKEEVEGVHGAVSSSGTMLPCDDVQIPKLADKLEGTGQSSNEICKKWSFEEEVARLTQEMEQVMAENPVAIVKCSPLSTQTIDPDFYIDDSPAVRIGSPTIDGDLQGHSVVDSPEGMVTTRSQT
ncbi:hypothetical protein O6H91_10G023600 [Diphasiastrum complanatum]|uniref:Uncharacterized protein n=2 Tax=Diphasiastrum complanatum TaxID=34168 RepID=A0ACC2CG44_DIPCM|nr:hypothetical protein O6H91_10G023600 [Diphasiastrum complanatum]